MAATRDRTLFKERGVEVTRRRFVEPGGQEYRTADILAVTMEVVEEQADRRPVRWWYTAGGGAIVGFGVAAIGDFAGQWLTGGILVFLMSVAFTWYFNRIRSGRFKVYHIVVTLPTARGRPAGASHHILHQQVFQRAAQGSAGTGDAGGGAGMRVDSVFGGRYIASTRTRRASRLPCREDAAHFGGYFGV